MALRHLITPDQVHPVFSDSINAWAQNKEPLKMRSALRDLLSVPIHNVYTAKDQKNRNEVVASIWTTPSLRQMQVLIEDTLQEPVATLAKKEVSLEHMTQHDREMVGLYLLTQLEKPEPSVSWFRLKPHKFVNRLHNVIQLQVPDSQEDWLTSVSYILEVDGISVQNWLKFTAKNQIDSFLRENRNQQVGAQEVIHMGTVIATTLYGDIKDPVNGMFKKHPVYFEFDTLMEGYIDKLPPFFGKYFPFSKKTSFEHMQALEDFLSTEYKVFKSSSYWDKNSLALECAKIFAEFMTLHPLTDGNGVLIHALIDDVLEKNGYQPIPDWNGINIQKPLGELRSWMLGLGRSLNDWFEVRLLPINN